MATTHPPLEKFVELIQKHDSRVGLRMLYRAYDVKDPIIRETYRRLWHEIASRMEPGDVYKAPESEPVVYDPRLKIKEVVKKARSRAKKRKKKG